MELIKRKNREFIPSREIREAIKKLTSESLPQSHPDYDYVYQWNRALWSLEKELRLE